MAIRQLRLLPSRPSGSALPLFIFLPGMDGTGELLRPQWNGLKHAFDIRCLSIPSDDLTGWDGLLAQTASLIRREQQRSPSRRIHLCGESFGGCLALQLAACFPHLCDRLILINPASSAIRQPWMDWGASFTRWLPESLYRLSTLGLLPFLIEPRRVSLANRQALLRAMQSVSPQSAAWRISLLRNFVLEKLPLGRILQPVLIMASGADRLLPSVAEAGRLVRHLPEARSVLLPHSGHACLLESEIRLGSILRSHCFDAEPMLQR
jgi:pimeloyl-ACP methyl ester carboxylesterase